MKNSEQSSIQSHDPMPRASDTASAASTVGRIRAFIDAACGNPTRRQRRGTADDASRRGDQDPAYGVPAFR